MLGTFTHVMAYHVPTETVTLCDLAVIGTKYIRDKAIPGSIEVQAGSSVVLIVSHVHAADTIGNVLDIDLRLGDDSEFTSVELFNGAYATEVTIYATGIAPGEHTLKLESFDRNDEVFSALKIDTITIVVIESIEVDPETILATFT